MFDLLVATMTGSFGAGAVDAWSRVEAAACARRLAAMVTLLDDAYAADGSAERDQWCLDNWAAVCAHIGAAARITSGAASTLLLVATALRDRFPKVAEVFADGLIGYPLVRTIVTRAALVIDPDALNALDAALAEALRTWAPMSVDKTEETIDSFIAQVDPHAVRRTQTAARGRSVDIVIEDGSGLATVFATLFTPNAQALNTRLDAFADTVCPADPRTKDQRRSDALGAIALGAERLSCLCNTADCPAALNPPSTGVVVYVIAHQDTITGPGASTPAGPADPTPPTRPEPDDPADPAEPDDAPAADSAERTPSADDDAAGADAADQHAENACVEPESTISKPAVTDKVTDECAALDGQAPPMFTKPLHELTLTEALTPAAGSFSQIRPAAMMGGGFLPGPIARRTAIGATIRPIVYPGQAPPEPRYTPSRKLVEFVRCRDLTCRFPGCDAPATNCDVDHTIAWPYGPTQASNLKCLCRKHHLLKTFWGGHGGWRDKQLPDGTVIWTAPDGRTYATTPGSRLLFPELSEPTAPVVATGTPTPHTTGLTMPRRRTARAQDRARRINDERETNCTAIEQEVEPAATDLPTTEEPPDTSIPPF